MKTDYFFKIASFGIIVGMISVFVYNKNLKARDPLSISYNPYESGIYASGIVETFQKNGSNINIFPSVPGRVTAVLVTNGSLVKKGDPLLLIDSSTQSGISAQSEAQALVAKANLVSVQDQYSKLQKSYSLNQKSVSKNALDNAKNAVIIAAESMKAAEAQAAADAATLAKYTVKSPVDGVILRMLPSVGDYVSVDIGAYDPYTQGYLPIIQVGETSQYLQVRVFVDELLTPQLPEGNDLEATLFVRGMNNKSIPLRFVNIQPLTIPNIELSDQRKERVDVRVLPIIFQFEKPKDITLYPGQLVDVYIKAKA